MAISFEITENTQKSRAYYHDMAAEKMRATLEAHTFVIGSEEIRITMSFGVSGIDDGVQEAEDLIQRADQAMYKAKGSGRNKVEIYQK